MSTLLAMALSLSIMTNCNHTTPKVALAKPIPVQTVLKQDNPPPRRTKQKSQWIPERIHQRGYLNSNIRSW